MEVSENRKPRLDGFGCDTKKAFANEVGEDPGEVEIVTVTGPLAVAESKETGTENVPVEEVVNGV